jgi:GNAT superfamily N-acetyltransferase
MNSVVQFAINKASAAQVEHHLRCCDAQFVPRLSLRVDLVAYAEKLVQRATGFEAWSEGELVGLVAAYFDNIEQRLAHITNVSVVDAWKGQGIAATLVQQCLDHAKRSGMHTISLEVSADNAAARRLYDKAGFQTVNPQAGNLTMHRQLVDEGEMDKQRDYNVEMKDNEGRRYAYGFDFDVMHPYMVRSFDPYFRPGSLLELGSFKGDFTRRLLQHFSDVTCVEA